MIAPTSLSRTRSRASPIRFVGDEATRRPQMDDRARLGRGVAKGVDVGHHVMPEPLFVAASSVEVDLVDFRAQRLDLGVGDRQPQRTLRVGERNPEPPPGRKPPLRDQIPPFRGWRAAYWRISICPVAYFRVLHSGMREVLTSAVSKLPEIRTHSLMDRGVPPGRALILVEITVASGPDPKAVSFPRSRDGRLRFPSARSVMNRMEPSARVPERLLSAGRRGWARFVTGSNEISSVFVSGNRDR